MKILFVCSGNRTGGVNPLIKAQGDSIGTMGHSIDYFLIKDAGITGYIKHIPLLRNYVKAHKPDIIHAHFSYSGFVAALAGEKPLVVSLMGTDVNANFLHRLICYPFNILFWDNVIVKSKDMKAKLNIENAHVLPNGVDTSTFRPYTREISLEKLNWDSGQIHILFAANPMRPEKNYTFAKKIVDKLQNEINQKVSLHPLVNVSHDLVPYYMNAANIVLLTSLWEGSPNVIKEAMACNRPIVTTNVGDVSWLLNDEEGSFVVESDIETAFEKLKEAIEFSDEHWTTDGRNKIFKLGLDSENIADKILNLYEKIL